jgi:hypothetical protein
VWLRRESGSGGDAAYICAKYGFVLAGAVGLSLVVVGYLTQDPAFFRGFAVAGLAALPRAVVLITNYRGLQVRLAKEERESWLGALGFQANTRFGGVILLLIACGWVIGGLVGP